MTDMTGLCDYGADGGDDAIDAYMDRIDTECEALGVTGPTTVEMLTWVGISRADAELFTAIFLDT